MFLMLLHVIFIFLLLVTLGVNLFENNIFLLYLSELFSLIYHSYKNLFDVFAFLAVVVIPSLEFDFMVHFDDVTFVIVLYI